MPPALKHQIRFRDVLLASVWLNAAAGLLCALRVFDQQVVRAGLTVVPRTETWAAELPVMIRTEDAAAVPTIWPHNDKPFEMMFGSCQMVEELVLFASLIQ